MKEIEPLLEGTIFTTKTAFAAEAIKEKIEAVKKEQAEHSLKLLTDEFTDKQVQYRRYGINNIADLARTTIMNTENIKKLEMKLMEYKLVEIVDEVEESSMKKFEKDNPVFTKEISDYTARKITAMNKGLMEILKRSEKQN